MRSMLMLLMIAALAGCASRAHRADSRQVEFDQHLRILAVDMDAGKMTRKQAAISARTKADELFSDPNMTEIWTYRVFLADEMEAGRMTEPQIQYLDTQKVNQIMDRIRSSQARVALPSSYIRQTITCRTDALGTTRCQ